VLPVQREPQAHRVRLVSLGLQALRVRRDRLESRELQEPQVLLVLRAPQVIKARRDRLV